MPHEYLLFAIFILFISSILLLDLGVFDKRNHIIPFKEALTWTLLWVALSIGFYFFLYFYGDYLHLNSESNLTDLIALTDKYDHPIKIEGMPYEKALTIYKHNLALEFLTGYLIEKALSVDNIFVIIMIFLAFGVSPLYYRKVLFWGILLAIVLRFIFIFVASALILKFNWILYFFGLLLIYTGIQMFLTRNKKEQINVANHPVTRFSSKYLPIYPKFLRHHFFIRHKGNFYITPLFIVLLVVEFSDLIFAVDSIPAIFSVAKDPYIVFFSNVFAILGLRAMFFMLVNIMNKFRFLKTGLSVLMLFIGLKMIGHHWLKIIGFSTAHSLYVIIFILIISILASLFIPEKKTTE